MRRTLDSFTIKSSCSQLLFSIADGTQIRRHNTENKGMLVGDYVQGRACGYTRPIMVWPFVQVYIIDTQTTFGVAVPKLNTFRKADDTPQVSDTSLG